MYIKSSSFKTEIVTNLTEKPLLTFNILPTKANITCCVYKEREYTCINRFSTMCP